MQKKVLGAPVGTVLAKSRTRLENHHAFLRGVIDFSAKPSFGGADPLKSNPTTTHCCSRASCYARPNHPPMEKPEDPLSNVDPPASMPVNDLPDRRGTSAKRTMIREHFAIGFLSL